MVDTKAPYHIAVIMDGNGRWAKERGLPRTLGHKEGITRVRELVKEAGKLGVKIVTVFAFSSENWSRSPEEINALFSFMGFFLDSYKAELMELGVKICMVGRRDRIDKGSMKKFESFERLTKDNTGVVFNVALDYGGRWDIVNAVRDIADKCMRGEIKSSDITEDNFGDYLTMRGIPDPDLLIRTSGEQRMSNFLLWNLAYSEFYFCDKHWPDFDKDELKKALDAYAARQRRFGKA